MTESAPSAPRAVVIGASAGAVEALLHVLPQLPRGYPLPVLVVVHVPPQRRNVLASLFAARCPLDVREPDDKEPAAPGTILFAPPDYHMLVEADRTISLSVEGPVQFSRPSIDVLFESAADAYGPGLIGAVLTGANHDGAEGLAAVAAAGGMAIVQDPAQAAYPVMPEAALALTPHAERLTLDGLVRRLLAAGDRSSGNQAGEISR